MDERITVEVRTLRINDTKARVEVGALYATDHIETRLTPKQARALRSLCDGLERQGAQVAAPKSKAMQLVRSAPAAVRWLLERVADGAAIGDDGAPVTSSAAGVRAPEPAKQRPASPAA